MMRQSYYHVAPPRETAIERDIMQYLQLRGYHARRTHSAQGRKSRPSKAGTLDIVFARGAVWGYIETKAEGGALRDKQVEEIAAIQRAGGLAIVARNVEDVIAAGI